VSKKKKKPALPEGVKMLVRNKRATHDYEISDRYEAGLVLLGSEVKALRDQNATLGDGFVEIRGGEAWLVGVQIMPYKHGSEYFAHDPRRRRKLLLHRREIKKLDTKASIKGFTLVPLSLYLKDGRVKLEFGVGRGKREFEKRESKKSAEAKREIDSATKRY
jgi:SsrA-binding protein